MTNTSRGRKLWNMFWNLYIISIRRYCYINTFFDVWQVLSLRSFLKLNLMIGFNLWRFVPFIFFFSLFFFFMDRFMDEFIYNYYRWNISDFKRFSFSFKGQDVPGADDPRDKRFLSNYIRGRFIGSLGPVKWQNVSKS